MIRIVIIAAFVVVMSFIYKEKNRNTQEMIVGRWERISTHEQLYTYNYSTSQWDFLKVVMPRIYHPNFTEYHPNGKVISMVAFEWSPFSIKYNIIGDSLIIIYTKNDFNDKKIKGTSKFMLSDTSLTLLSVYTYSLAYYSDGDLVYYDAKGDSIVFDNYGDSYDTFADRDSAVCAFRRDSVDYFAEIDSEVYHSEVRDLIFYHAHTKSIVYEPNEDSIVINADEPKKQIRVIGESYYKPFSQSTDSDSQYYNSTSPFIPEYHHHYLRNFFWKLFHLRCL